MKKSASKCYLFKIAEKRKSKKAIDLTADMMIRSPTASNLRRAHSKLKLWKTNEWIVKYINLEFIKNLLSLLICLRCFLVHLSFSSFLLQIYPWSLHISQTLLKTREQRSLKLRTNQSRLLSNHGRELWLYC